MADKQELYKIFLFSSVSDEIFMLNTFKMEFVKLTRCINVINHNIDIPINEKSRVTAITINNNISNMEDFLNNQRYLIYNHFDSIRTNNMKAKRYLLKKIKEINIMYDIEFIAETPKIAAEIIKCILNICKCCDGLLLNYDGSKFVDKDNNLILDDEGNSNIRFKELKVN